MKIALIGTSPIIVLIAHRLSKNNQVTIFDYSKEFGGAWSWENFRKISVPNKTNVIVPANSKEEKKIKEIIITLYTVINLKMYTIMIYTICIK